LEKRFSKSFEVVPREKRTDNKPAMTNLTTFIYSQVDFYKSFYLSCLYLIYRYIKQLNYEIQCLEIPDTEKSKAA